MSTLSAEMAFEIGDFVYLKHHESTPELRPRRYMVYERHIQECHGGVQRFYRVAGLEGPVAEICLSKEIPPMDESAEIERAKACGRVRAALRLIFDHPTETPAG